MEEKEIQILERRFDRRYKMLEDCEREMREADRQHHHIDLRLTVIEHGQKINNWLTGAIAGGIVALVIKVFLG